MLEGVHEPFLERGDEAALGHALCLGGLGLALRRLGEPLRPRHSNNKSLTRWSRSTAWSIGSLLTG